ncbi:MAG TPA: hypothetical protein VG742_07000 [Dongiaceae bacterium]|nr:hypothetical protein [Dongiaceae bacterium]
MKHEQDQLLAAKQQSWHAFTRLLLWGTIVAAVATLVAVMFAY